MKFCLSTKHSILARAFYALGLEFSANPSLKQIWEGSLAAVAHLYKNLKVPKDKLCKNRNLT